MESIASEALPETPHLPLDLIEPGPNPRTYFDDEEMAELVASVKASGIYQPVLVRPVGNRFELVAGGRRFKAARLAGLTSIPVTIRVMSDEEAAAAALTENAQRTPPGEASDARAAYALVYQLSGDKDEAARLLGWTVQKLESRMRLMQCTSEVLDALDKRTIRLGHADLLAGIPKEKQNKALRRIVDGNLSVAFVKASIGKISHQLATAIFDTHQCAQCPYNSDRQSALGFTEVVGAGYCTNGEHFEQLTNEELERRAAARRDDYPKVVIVEPEDGFQPLYLRADGPLGVGAQQESACKGCANYGCAVSALPDSMGKVWEPLCFDAPCNQKKVADRIKAEKAESAACAPATSKPDAPTISRKSVASAAPLAKAKAISAGVQNYRRDEWKRIAAKELHRQPDKAAAMLVALGLTRHLSYCEESRYRKTLEKLHDQIPAYNLFDAAEFAIQLPSEQREVAVHLLGCASAYGLPDDELVRLLGFLEVDIAAHWRLNKEFLNLLTKSEIEAVADELGIKKAMKGGFAKLASANKQALISGVLNVAGFQYEGAVPKVMLYDKRNAARRAAIAQTANDAVSDEPADTESTA